MPGARTTDIALPNEGPADPTIPVRAQRQADLKLQKSSREYEMKPVTRDEGLTIPRAARQVRAASRHLSGGR
jgi:hypothetical protein